MAGNAYNASTTGRHYSGQQFKGERKGNGEFYRDPAPSRAECGERGPAAAAAARLLRESPTGDDGGDSSDRKVAVSEKRMNCVKNCPRPYRGHRLHK